MPEEIIEPISHLEQVIAYYGIGGGSGSGTSDYNALQNKPSINGVELSGNKTLTDLGIKNYVYYFNSISDMKDSSKLKVGDFVITKGYYEANDGGAGEYEIIDNNSLVDNGGSVHNLSNGLKAKLIIKNGEVNVKQFGARGDGVNDDIIPIKNSFLIGDVINLNSGDLYYISDSIQIFNKNIKLNGNNSIIKSDGKSISFKANNEDNISYNCNDIKKSLYITSNSEFSGINIGDYIQVSGTLSNDLYTPERYKDISIICKVVNIEDKNIYLDRKIQFNIISAKFKKVNLLSIQIDNIKLEETTLTANYLVNSNINIYSSSINTELVNAISIEKSLDSKFIVNIFDNRCNNGFVINDCNNIECNLSTTNIGISGNDSTRGSTSKSIRGNGLQNLKIYSLNNKSYGSDCVIYGSASLYTEIISHNAGYANELLNITTDNRGEAILFGECEDITLKPIVYNCSDQAVEYLKCINSKILNADLVSDKNSSGLLNIKAGSRNIDIISPIINSYASGIRVECIETEGMNDNESCKNITINNPIVSTSKENDSAILIRFATKDYDSNVAILGGKIKSYIGVSIDKFSNNNYIKDTVFYSTGGHCVILNSDNNIVSKINCINTNGTQKRAVYSSKSNNKIEFVKSDGGCIYYGYEGESDFSFDNCINNRVPYLMFSSMNKKIFINDLGLYSCNESSEYLPNLQFNKGFEIYNNNITEQGSDGSKYIIDRWICIEGGTPGIWIANKILTGN